MSELKLLAIDSEDLEVVSAHAQDAIVRVADMGFSQNERRFILLINRYVWEKGKKRKKDKGERRRAALRFDFVQNVQTKGFDLNAKEGALELLSIEFNVSSVPSGFVILNFAGGATLKLELECLEVRLHDLGGAWAANMQPKHDID